MSYDELTDHEVLEDIQSGCVPDNALIDSLAWRHICSIQARYSREIDPDIWYELCQRRGKLRK